MPLILKRDILEEWLGGDGFARDAAEAPDVARFCSSEAVGAAQVPCTLSWAFWDGQLFSIDVRPTVGRDDLDRLLSALGVTPDGLHDEGDGLASQDLGHTRVDVDRLDGYISLREVST